MNLKKEKAFPRGGKKPAFLKSATKFSLVKKPKPKVKRKSKKAKKQEKERVVEKDNTTNKALDIKYVEELKATVAQEGMLVLGIVSQVTEKVVNVSLPGRLRGVINVANVSEFYKNRIENMTEDSEVLGLRDLFEKNDILPVKILSVSEDHPSLMLTSDPKSINQKLLYSVIEEGFILTGSVKSKEDYGFIIDFGIENVNGFLNFKKIEPTKTLKVGGLARCCVTKCNVSPGSCNVHLSMLQEDFQRAVIKKSSKLPIYCFIPGFQFEVTFKKILHDGVEISYGKDNSKGYIHEDQLLKKFPKLSDVEIDSEKIATLLYVKPLVNFPYFKIMPKNPPEWPFAFGEIVSGRVAKVKRSGIVFKIVKNSKTAKCFVPLSKLKNINKLTENDVEITSLYPLNKKVSKIRIGQPNYMGRYYLGATDKESIEEKYFSVSDLKYGEVVSCKIISFGKSSARLSLGKTVTGLVAFEDMTNVPLKNPASKFKIGDKVKARVVEINPESRFVRLTMKPNLLKEKNILTDVKECKEGDLYVGNIKKVFDNKLIVKFFNQIKGIIPKHFTPYFYSTSLRENYSTGQLVKCYITKVTGDKTVSLSLLSGNLNLKVEVGKKYKVKVTCVSKNGLILDVHINKEEKCEGYLPTELLTAHRALAAPFKATYSSGEKFFAHCVINDPNIGVPVFGKLEIFDQFYDGKSSENFQKILSIDSVLPFLYRSKHKTFNTVYLQSLIPGKSDLFVKVKLHDLNDVNVSFVKYQLIYGKIINISENKVDVSIKLSHVWDKNFHVSLELLDSYLSSMSALIKRQREKLDAYNEDLTLGSYVEGTIEEVRSNNAIVRTKSGDLGLVEGKFEKNENIIGKVVWIDGIDQMIYIVKKNVTTGKNKKSLLSAENRNLRGRVVFISQETVVVELAGKGRGQLSFMPRRRHVNDFVINECVFTVNEIVKVWVTRKKSNFLVAMDRRIIDLKIKSAWKNSENKLKKSVQSLKRKLHEEKTENKKSQVTESEADEVEVVSEKLTNKYKNINGDSEGNIPDLLPEVKVEIDVDDEILNSTSNGIPRLEDDDVEIKSENEEEEEKDELNLGLDNSEKIPLSSSSESEDEEECNVRQNEHSNAFRAGFNWEVLKDQSLLSGVTFKKEESSDDDEDDSMLKSKRRRLTAREKREKAKAEEERLRLIEERLMDTEKEPETADDFDRAVLANPGSSALWLKYMAFYVQGTEIEKARAVARRALKSISFRDEQEKLNIWIALLNLENLYGNEDSLNKTLGEALQSNDSCKVHLHMLNMHGQNGKFQEMEKLGNFIIKKYKNVGNIWYDVATAFFSVGKVESARNLFQKALNIINKSQHVAFISKFSQLENKYGSQERAQTLYESILASFPKRVDVWSCYVDMLVKSNRIDLARQVLERATSQSLRPRKMKTLFKKFLTFEENHGTPEDVEKVRQAAVEYVQTVGAFDE